MAHAKKVEEVQEAQKKVKELDEVKSTLSNELKMLQEDGVPCTTS